MKQSLNQTFQDDKTKTYEVIWRSMFSGQVVVPNASDKPIDFIAYSGINMAYARQIASWLYREFKRDIFIRTAKKSALLKAESFEKPVVEKKVKKDDLKWRVYNAYGKRYIGKIAEFNYKYQTAIELRVKKCGASADDVIHSVRSLLKRYQTVKLTTADNADTFANIGADFDLGVIEYIVKNKFGFKSESKKSVKEQTPTQNANIEKFIAKNTEYENTIHIDPMVLSKTLTLTMNPKQTVDAAKKRAQQMANLQYVAVKLLDSKGKFVCNIYPQDVEKIRATRIEKMKELAHRMVY